jgi:hypothetical protein
LACGQSVRATPYCHLRVANLGWEFFLSALFFCLDLAPKKYYFLTLQGRPSNSFTRVWRGRQKTTEIRLLMFDVIRANANEVGERNFPDFFIDSGSSAMIDRMSWSLLTGRAKLNPLSPYSGFFLA